MKATQELHDLGQSLWLDNITRTMLDDGTLEGYINDLSVTGLTSNPTIFEKAVTAGDTYNEQMDELRSKGLDAEPLFFEMAITDLQRAADLFRAEHDRTDGLLRFEIRATAFCHQMVRSIVGTLVDVGRGRRRAGDVAEILAARSRTAAGSPAPPQGLCLWEVGYPDPVAP